MTTETPRVSTGIDGADDVLHGGFVSNSSTLVRGSPGAGKTIFGLHFLAEGVAGGEDTLYINLGEPKEYLRQTAAAFGLDLDTVTFLDLSPSADQFRKSESYDLFLSSEVEQPALIDTLRSEVESVSPDRVVVDPVTELKYLSSEEHQFRTQILSLLDLLKSEGATVLLTSQAAPSVADDDLQFLADAVINLHTENGRRRLQVPKLRGSGSERGPHTVTITGTGMHVWPRLAPADHGRDAPLGRLASGVDGLDGLINGGLTTGTVTFLSGPTGVGKTTLGLQFLTAAARGDRRAVLYSFEEARKTMLTRADEIGIPAREMVEEGLLRIESVDPDELTVDEFTSQLETHVTEGDTEVVMIDGVTGFARSLGGVDDDGTEQLVRIGRYLRNMGVTAIISNEVHQITGSFRATEQQLSHLADNIIVLRHVEHDSELRKVIGVLKMRASDCAPTIQELMISEDGISVGEPLSGMRGILTGTPDWDDDG
ncbi:ATPase domain-containing protein [Natranaeroarchaeum aerophilus]|uniref:non-specific serine/threonine protein kinase n=1 Tax=Natranaeroarchaeum aerophilus TaxID=2917711 RepID=A0AAE3K5L9_9EURY|nr:ATPase domain-containing protein [Natranaeroarchaeum aerophilus]MCL9814076.1 AAA family ATPase [Natranaeroarchaeum aerophilus]